MDIGSLNFELVHGSLTAKRAKELMMAVNGLIGLESIECMASERRSIASTYITVR